MGPSGDRRESHLTHGAYAVDRLVRRDGLDSRTALGRRVRDMRLAYALAYGYPTWGSIPRPLQAAIKSAVRLELFCERLFSPFWSEGEVPQRFLTATENLRRLLVDMGLEPRAVSKSLDLYVREKYGSKP